MISLYKNDTQLGTELSFEFSEAIAEKGKAFSDGEFVKHCLMTLAERACPDQKYLIEQTTVVYPDSLWNIKSMPSQVILKMLWLKV